MPHKKNPIISERISGMARLLRGNAVWPPWKIWLSGMKGIFHILLWNGLFCPIRLLLLYYMLKKTIGLIDNLLVYPETMEKNMNLTKGLVYSQAVLLALTRKGVSREDAYRLVQQNAMKVWDQAVSFEEAIKSDDELKKVLSEADTNELFNIHSRLKNLDKIFKRVGLL